MLNNEFEAIPLDEGSLSCIVTCLEMLEGSCLNHQLTLTAIFPPSVCDRVKLRIPSDGTK